MANEGALFLAYGAVVQCSQCRSWLRDAAYACVLRSSTRVFEEKWSRRQWRSVRLYVGQARRGYATIANTPGSSSDTPTLARFPFTPEWKYAWHTCCCIVLPRHCEFPPCVSHIQYLIPASAQYLISQESSVTSFIFVPFPQPICPAHDHHRRPVSRPARPPECHAYIAPKKLPKTTWPCIFKQCTQNNTLHEQSKAKHTSAVMSTAVAGGRLMAVQATTPHMGGKRGREASFGATAATVKSIFMTASRNNLTRFAMAYA